MVQPADQRPISGPIEGEQGFAPQGEVDPEVAATIELDTPPAPQEPAEIPLEIRAKKGQVGFNVVKIVGYILTAPITLPYVALHMIGWTAAALFDAKSPGEFKRDVQEGFDKVFKPVTKAKDEVIGGLAGVTGKVYRGAMKEAAFEQQYGHFFAPQQKDKNAKEGIAAEDEGAAYQQELDAAAQNLAPKPRAFQEEGVEGAGENHEDEAYQQELDAAAQNLNQNPGEVQDVDRRDEQRPDEL